MTNIQTANNTAFGIGKPLAKKLPVKPQTTIQKAQALLAQMKASEAGIAKSQKIVTQLTTQSKANSADTAANVVTQKENLVTTQQNQADTRAEQILAGRPVGTGVLAGTGKSGAGGGAGSGAGGGAGSGAGGDSGGNTNGNGDGGVTPENKPTATGQTWTDPVTGDQYSLMSDNSKVLLASDTYGIQRKNAFDLLQQQFKTFGLIRPGDTKGNDLLTTLKSLIYSGAGNDTVSLALQQSEAYQARFSGNKARLAQGLSVLSPAEYLATENSYDAILKAAGVPTAFYQGTDEKAKLIGGDISPTELQDRVNVAAKSIANQDPYYSQTLQNYYGLSAGDMIAHTLDPQAALPLLQRQQGAANFGAAAARQGLNVAS